MKLSEIQKALKVPKNQFNKFGGYSYRNAEDILEAVKPLLGDSVLTLSDEVVNIGNRNYVKATATFFQSRGPFQGEDLSGDYYERTVVTAYACEAAERKGMDASQITGAASSYARKYALNGLFLIDDTKDADSDVKAHVEAPSAYEAMLEEATTLEELKKAWSKIPKEERQSLEEMKDRLKVKLQ